MLIRRNANLSTGGTATDVTDLVHPEVAARAVEAARMIGLDIAGVDVVASDIGRPLEEQGGVIVEVNAGPGLRMHLEPSAGKPRPVGEAIVDSLFPDGENGRIPIVAVTGVNGKTTTTRFIAHILRSLGPQGRHDLHRRHLHRRRGASRPAIAAARRAPQAVLVNPAVEAAVLETARGGILREGLGLRPLRRGRGDQHRRRRPPGPFRHRNARNSWPRSSGRSSTPCRPTGTAVLKADDPLVAAMARDCKAPVIFFAAATATTR